MDTLPGSLQAALEPAYELERELAGGGMSRVFLAHDQKLGRKVVVKVLPPDLAAGVNKDRFRREIQFAAQLLHPHIVQVISAGETDDLLYYTMPYIEGESLRTQLERGELSSKRVIRILHDIVDALAYAHERGVIHRDIKPGNILTLGSHALVTDFGVAKAISAATPGSGVTSAGLAIGTPAYMAPEQLAADPEADHRVDIYAVGLLAYELLTGSSPFKQESPQATMAAQLTRVPTPLDVCCPGVAPDLSRVVMRCLEKDPKDRYQSAKELLAALDNLGVPVSGNSFPNLITPALQQKKFSRALIAAGAVAGIVGIGYAAYSTSRTDTSQTAVSSSTAAISPAMTKQLQPAPVAPPQPAAAPVTRQRVLTHADSLAIARAIRDEKSAAVSVPVPLPQVANSGQRRSLLIMLPRPNPMRADLNGAARQFFENLRRSAESTGTFSLVPTEAMRRARFGAGDPRAVAGAIKPDIVVTMNFVGNDPQSLAVQMHDVRTGRSNSVLVLGAPSGSGAPLKDTDAAIRETLAKLDALGRD